MNDVDDNCNYDMDHVGIDYGSHWPVQQNAYCGNQTAFEVYSDAYYMYVSFRAIPVGVRGKRGFKAHFFEGVAQPDLKHTGICTVLITYLVLLFLSL